tara:strand:+ start:487 stop:723 length:237 start_codon:yes stop_codon:yes gene_type:complete
MNVKRLKDTTIQRYNAQQLRRHLDRLQDQFEAGEALYRIDQYEIREFISSDYYRHFCNINSRYMIIEAIYHTYLKLGL